ncbi:DUF3231 family protein [Natribacillus halophilus]|uniref:DUF3231 family protein n=1 Tax=Natribacillus halophilus TaxID=549003 RepID=A0A1G8QA67_9BACI|nr:DUF3231 family protein [Natribacillus halophilus]SDJ01456.1 Protein of unknown function [Natribacillus halophilus]
MTEKIHLTSGEIGSLWTSYMNNSMSTCMLAFMLKHISDQDIQPVVQYAYDISSNNKEQIRTIFENESYVVPNAFSEQDVNMNAPWLFTDVFCLSYVNHMAKVGMISYSGMLSMSARDDIRTYFTQMLTEASDLFNQSSDIAFTKGLNYRHPYIEGPKETDYVDSKAYFKGFNPFSDQRPLNAVEISHLYINTLTNSIGMKLCIAFAQSSPRKEVQDFMLRGKDISKKHIKIFVDILLEDEIEAPSVPDVGVSDSTTPPFSDKLMMFHMSLLISSGIGNYATAAAASQRSDLVTDYERLSLESAKLAKSGADIMIKHQWLEQPPGAKDREKLAKNKRDDV